MFSAIVIDLIVLHTIVLCQYHVADCSAVSEGCANLSYCHAENNLCQIDECVANYDGNNCSEGCLQHSFDVDGQTDYYCIGEARKVDLCNIQYYAQSGLFDSYYCPDGCNGSVEFTMFDVKYTACALWKPLKFKLGDDNSMLIISIVSCALIGVYGVFNLVIHICCCCMYCRNKERNAGQGLEFNFPRCCWVLLYILFIMMIVESAGYAVMDGGTGALTFAAVLIVSAILFCCSAQFCAMMHLSDLEGGDRYARDMRCTKPQLYYKIRCWHIEVYYTYTEDSDGNVTRTRHERTVTTYSATKYVSIPYWCDATPPLFLPGGRLLVHVITTANIEWMHGSEQIVENIRRRIYNNNLYRDDHCEVTKHTSIPNVVDDKMIVNGDQSKIPKLIRCPLRTLCTILGFGLALSVYIATVASVVRYRVRKRASFVEPCVTREWCAQYDLDYGLIAPTAQVVGDGENEDVEDGSADGSRPCVENPYPLLTFVYLPESDSYKVPAATPVSMAPSTDADGKVLPYPCKETGDLSNSSSTSSLPSTNPSTAIAMVEREGAPLSFPCDTNCASSATLESVRVPASSGLGSNANSVSVLLPVSSRTSSAPSSPAPAEMEENKNNSKGKGTAVAAAADNKGKKAGDSGKEEKKPVKAASKIQQPKPGKEGKVSAVEKEKTAAPSSEKAAAPSSEKAAETSVSSSSSSASDPASSSDSSSSDSSSPSSSSSKATATSTKTTAAATAAVDAAKTTGADDLPSGWVVRHDAKSNRDYYLNTVTKATTWKKPSVTSTATSSSSSNSSTVSDGLPSKTEAAGDAASSAADDLPSGWVVRHDPKSNRVYYLNSVTKETTWKKPGSTTSSTVSNGLPPEWEVKRDPKSDREYYVNTVTKERTWKRPTPAVAAAADTSAATTTAAATITPSGAEAAEALPSSQSDVVDAADEEERNVDGN